MDSLCYDVLSQLGLSDVRLIKLEDFERGDKELLKAKQNRKEIEYYFTCTPSLALYILNNHPEVDIITYLDADLFFFTDLGPIYDEISDYSIAIIEHRFPLEIHWQEIWGIYNVGWVSFRRDEQARDCLGWWRRQCIEWCYDRAEGGRFADQKYLDDWPTRFKNVKILQHKGADLAPWNLANYKIHKRKNRIWVDEFPLIFFHFHNLRPINRWLYDPRLVTDYRIRPSVIVRRGIYGAYIRTLSEVTQLVSPLIPKTESLGSIRYGAIKSRLPQPLPLFHQIKKSAKRWHRLLLRTFHGEYFIAINGQVI